MSNGWIKLHRKMLEWEWFDDHNTFRLFTFLLLSANHKVKSWKGNLIEEGEIVTSNSKLSQKVGLSTMQVRTSLNKLKSTHEITIKSTSKFTLIKINNWKEYQTDNKQNNKQITNEQQTNNKQITTNNNVKNIKNEKKYISEQSSHVEKIDVELSNLLLSEIQINLPTFKKPNINSWAQQISRMRRLDKRTPEQIEFVIRWSQKDTFWQSNILSTKKLREKFDQLVGQIKRQKTNSKSKGLSIGSISR